MNRSTACSTTDAGSLLPLKPVHFAVLLSLYEEARPGFGIMEHVNGQMNGTAIVGPGTLYRLLKEMREASLIERSDPPRDVPDDERRHYHKLTAFGREVVTKEAMRLRQALAAAGPLDLATEGGS